MRDRRISMIENLFKVSILLGSLTVLLMVGSAEGTNPTPNSNPTRTVLPARGQAYAFDFILGTWKVSNQRLAKRLQHSHQWIDFESTDVQRKLPTGLGNIEVYKTSYWPNFVGMSLLLYNPDTHQWTIYWTDNRFSRGVLQPPVAGSFNNGVGIFLGKDSFNGIPIIVRYTWRSLDHDHARWTQAFSTDHGKSWETNWIMHFTRTTIRENQKANNSQ